MKITKRQLFEMVDKAVRKALKEKYGEMQAFQDLQRGMQPVKTDPRMVSQLVQSVEGLEAINNRGQVVKGINGGLKQLVDRMGPELAKLGHREYKMQLNMASSLVDPQKSNTAILRVLASMAKDASLETEFKQKLDASLAPFVDKVVAAARKPQ